MKNSKFGRFVATDFTGGTQLGGSPTNQFIIAIIALNNKTIINYNYLTINSIKAPPIQILTSNNNY